MVNAAESLSVAPETIRIVIVDDNPIVRAGLRQVLEAAAEMTVVAEGASGANALRLLAQLQSDVLVLGVNLPDVSSVEVTRRVREHRRFLKGETGCVAFQTHINSPVNQPSRACFHSGHRQRRRRWSTG